MEHRILTVATYAALAIAGTYSVHSVGAPPFARCLIVPKFTSPPERPNTVAIVARTTSTAPLVSATTAGESSSYEPRTDLGRKLMAHRVKALRKGMELWSLDEINDYLRQQRGDIG